MKLSSLAQLNELDTLGTEVSYGDGLKLRIAPVGNENYDKSLQNQIGQYRLSNNYPTGELPEEVMNSIVRQAVAEGVLVGWTNLTDDDDKPIPYSTQKSRELIMGNYRFFRDVMILATNLRNSVLRHAQADAGNSPATSSGS